MGSRLPAWVQKDSTPSSALALWHALCEDAYFSEAPFKVETNVQGQIIMSPAGWNHGAYQFEIQMQLKRFADAVGVKGGSFPNAQY